jgi:site-specific recombinase XerD
MKILEQAIQQVPGFSEFAQRIHRRMRISELSLSTEKSYTRCLAKMAVHFFQVPTLLNKEQVEEYLYLQLAKVPDTELSSFRFSIYALRFAYRMEGMDELRLSLPSMRRKKRIPIVLSVEEITDMINRPTYLKHRMLIALLYGCGLRCSELRDLRVSDIDLDRRLLHVRQSKGRKDRMIPLGQKLIEEIQKYIDLFKPKEWLFSGYRNQKNHSFKVDIDRQFGKRSIQEAVKQAARLAGIRKNVNSHSLRHSYATHLLEQGVSIITLKSLLGHAHISATLIYLQTATICPTNVHSPLDFLNELRIFRQYQLKLSKYW